VELHRVNAEIKSLNETLENQCILTKQRSDELQKVKELLAKCRKESKEKQDRIDSLQQEIILEKDRFDKRVEFLQKTSRRELNIIADEKDEMAIRLDEKEKELCRIKCDAICLEEKLKTQHHINLNALTIENNNLFKVTQDLKNELELMKAENEKTNCNLMGSLELLQSEITNLSNENSILSAKKTSLEEIISEIKCQFNDVQSRLENVTNDLHLKDLDLVEAESKIKDLAIQNESLSSRLEERTAELFAEKRERDKLDKLSQESERKNQALLQKEKMKSSAYKQKALEAHARTMHAKQLLREMPK
jgi:chromosome segregation ATPase